MISNSLSKATGATEKQTSQTVKNGEKFYRNIKVIDYGRFSFMLGIV